MYLDIQKIIERIKPTDRVLDLGGWDRVFPRANVVVDLNPYETRHIVNPEVPEHFAKKDWIQADFCSASFWESVPDKSFDFVIISHTLEDIRDPLYVCSQMIRCAKAGYIEVPSKFRECAKESAEAIFAGYDHHRWIVEPNRARDGLIFKAKLSWAHQEDHVGDARRHLVTQDFHYQFNGFFWSGSFKYVEHFPKGSRKEIPDLKHFFENFTYGQMPEFLFELTPDSSSPDDGRCLWVNEYKLPTETDEWFERVRPKEGKAPPVRKYDRRLHDVGLMARLRRLFALHPVR